jgi:hypothetical protein
MTTVEIVVAGLEELRRGAGMVVTILLLSAWTMVVWLPVMGIACWRRHTRPVRDRGSFRRGRQVPGTAPDPPLVGGTVRPPAGRGDG